MSLRPAGRTRGSPVLEFADRLPPLAEFVASALVGDLQRATPPESRIDPEVTMHFLPDANQSTAIYEPILADIDRALRTSFFGDNMVECFKRMGDPLPVGG